jgi:hypothetical protein
MKMYNLTQLQEVYFDICDLVMSDPALMKTKIKGLSEFETLGEFLQYQREKLEDIEQANLEVTE